MQKNGMTNLMSYFNDHEKKKFTRVLLRHPPPRFLNISYFSLYLNVKMQFCLKIEEGGVVIGLLLQLTTPRVSKIAVLSVY